MIVTKSIKNIIIIFIILFPFLSGLSAQESKTETHQDKEEFEITDLIMHHIKDSHNFHVYGDVKNHFPKSLSIPLPIILWTNNGLVTFMSSKFKHDESGKIVVEKKGQKFVISHGKVYYAKKVPNKQGEFVSYNKENHPVNKKPLDFSITKNVFSMFLSVILLIILFKVSANSYKKSKDNVPTGLAKFMEPIVVFVRDEIAIPNIGENNYSKYMPFLLTLFFFIWINNLIGMIPFFPFGSNLSGNIAFTGGLAVVTFIITIFSSKKDYWTHMLWMPGIPVPMKIFLAPIELLGMFIKPLALMIRLFANITAGHVTALSLIGLIFILHSFWVAPASVLFTTFISMIEILVVAIQAYIFTMLSALYFGQALEQEH